MEYEKTLKKLINILRIKSVDNVKQIEDLWESLSSLTAPQSSANKLTPTRGMGGSRVDDDNSNDSITSNQSTKSAKRALNDSSAVVKKIKRSNSPPGVAAKGAVRLSANLAAKKNQLSSLGVNKAKKHLLDSEMDSVSSGGSVGSKKARSAAMGAQNEWSNSSTGSSLSRSASSTPTDDLEFDCNSNEHDEHFNGDAASACASGSSADDASTDKYASSTKIYEYVIEMGLTCDTCKLLTQESNNKLVECQECKRMFHQQCHRPSISNEEISDPRKLWYCSKCIKSVRNFAAKNSKTNSSNKSEAAKLNGSGNSVSSGKQNTSLNGQQTLANGSAAKKLFSAPSTTNYFNVSQKTALHSSSTSSSAL